MKKRAVSLVLIVLLALSACGSGEAKRVEEENENLREQVAALEEENAAMREVNTAFQTSQTENKYNEYLEENPIDAFYDAAFLDLSSGTVEINTIFSSYVGAWEAEVRNLAEQMKSRLPLQEDRDMVDAYISAVEEQVRCMDIMAVFPISDIEVPQADRIGTAGDLRDALWAGAQITIWRDTFYQLRWILPGDQSYDFIFDPEDIVLENEP